MNDLFQYPLAYWLSLSVLVGVSIQGWFHRQRGWGFPAMAVSFSTIAWYHGDAFYNGYSETFLTAFAPEILNGAWLEVMLFGLALAGFLSFMPDLLNQKYRGRVSQVERLRTSTEALRQIQPGVTDLAYAVACLWLVLFGFTLWRVNWNVLGLVAPYLGTFSSGWGRGQIAESWMDSIATVVQLLLQVCASIFGVCAATMRNGLPRFLMLALIFVSWPSFFFDRTRYVMLLVLIPGLLAFVFFQLRGRPFVQVSLLVLAFYSTDIWFKFIITNRGENSIAEAFASGLVHDSDLQTAKHNGFNMFEELCWINKLMDSGDFTPNKGGLYLANLANPIPRALWPNKPTMGLDYAIARGQSGDKSSGVSATIAVGMVGSGLVNFGKLLGPVAAAFLMTLWCAFLARLDLAGADFGRLLIYLVGLITIFLFGRDITIMLTYPALFGFGLLSLWRQFSPLSQVSGHDGEDEKRKKLSPESVNPCADNPEVKAITVSQ